MRALSCAVLVLVVGAVAGKEDATPNGKFATMTSDEFLAFLESESLSHESIQRVSAGEDRAIKIELAENATHKLIQDKQATALEIFESGRCDLVECLCSKQDDGGAQCLRTIYTSLFGNVEPNYPEFLALEYLAAGVHATYLEAYNLAELKPCNEWPNLDGKFAATNVACSTNAEERRRMLVTVSPTPQCPSGSWIKGTACEECRTCAATNRYLKGCGGTSAGDCVLCRTCAATNRFLRGCRGTNPGNCVLCKTCSPGISYESTPCGGQTNRVCKLCRSACATGTFESTPCTVTSNRKCTRCRSACGTGTYQTAACTQTTNRVCTRCESCGGGYYRAGCRGLSGPGVCRRCASLPKCPVGYKRVGCAGVSPGTCEKA